MKYLLPAIIIATLSAPVQAAKNEAELSSLKTCVEMVRNVWLTMPDKSEEHEILSQRYYENCFVEYEDGSSRPVKELRAAMLKDKHFIGMVKKYTEQGIYTRDFYGHEY